MISHNRAARILTIDDDLDTLGLIQMVLRRAGYDVTTASRWDEILGCVNDAKEKSQLFDLIILDVMMPEQSGFDTYRSIEKILKSMPPVIFLSAIYAVEDTNLASDLGAAKYLLKPTSPDKLLAAVKAVLEHAS